MNRLSQLSCRACGAANAADSRFCAQCGASLAETSANPYSSTYLPPAHSTAEMPYASDVEGPDQALLAKKKRSLEAVARSGVRWFYWIGGLSLLNTVIFLTGGTLHFIVGLGATQVIDVIAAGVARKHGNNVRLVGFALDIVIAGLFIAMGVLSRDRLRWIVVVGMILYALDGLIFVWLKLWMGVGFHLFALFWIWNGLKAMNNLRTLE